MLRPEQGPVRQAGTLWGLAGLSFIAVYREGRFVMTVEIPTHLTSLRVIVSALGIPNDAVVQIVDGVAIRHVHGAAGEEAQHAD